MKGPCWPEVDLHIEAECRKDTSVNKTIIGSGNGLAPIRRQTIIWTNAAMLLIGPLGQI